MVNRQFRLEDAIGFTIEKTVKVLRTALEAAFSEAGYKITAYQFHILFRLWQQEGLFLSQLKEGTVVDNSKITRDVDTLEKRGYVRRQICDTDRRKIRLYLTESGSQLQHALVPIQVRHYEKTLVGVRETDLTNLKRILAKVERNFQSSNQETEQ